MRTITYDLEPWHRHRQFHALRYDGLSYNFDITAHALFGPLDLGLGAMHQKETAGVSLLLFWIVYYYFC